MKFLSDCCDYLLIFLIVFFIASCAAPSYESVPSGSVIVHAEGGSAAVQEIVLPSGTRCAVLVGYNTGAINCDWKLTLEVAK